MRNEKIPASAEAKAEPTNHTGIRSRCPAAAKNPWPPTAARGASRSGIITSSPTVAMAALTQNRSR